MSEKNEIKEIKTTSKKTEKRSKDDEYKEQIKETLVELKDLLEVIKYLGIKSDDEQGRENITSAVKHAKSRDHKKTLESLQESSDFLKEKIEDYVEKEIEDMRSELSKESDHETINSQNIKRDISKLEEAYQAKEYEDIPEHFFRTWNELKRIKSKSKEQKTE